MILYEEGGRSYEVKLLVTHPKVMFYIFNMDYRGSYNRLGQACYLTHMSVAG